MKERIQTSTEIGISCQNEMGTGQRLIICQVVASWQLIGHGEGVPEVAMHKLGN